MRFRSVNLLFCLLLILFQVFVSPPLSPGQQEQKAHLIQVFSSKDLTTAETFANDLKKNGYSPVNIIPKGEWQAVCIGVFANYADAVFYKKELRSGSFPDAFIISCDISQIPEIPPLLKQQLKTDEVFHGTIRSPDALSLKGRKVSGILQEQELAPPLEVVHDSIMNAANSTLTQEDLLKKARALARDAKYEEAIQSYQDFVAQFSASSRIPEAHLGSAYVRLKQEKIEQSKAGFQNVMQEFPQTFQAGEAALRLGYLKIREKDDAGAKLYLENIVNGTVNASSDIKAEARMRLDNFERREKITTDPGFQLLHQGYAQLAASDEAGAEKTFEQVITSHSQSEATGEASLRLAYRNLEKAQKTSDPDEAGSLRQEALLRFEEIARGDIKSSASNRLEAMMRCAKVYHARKERIRALQAYREIASLTDADGAPDPDIHMEIAGLYMELARSEKGALADCISECDTVISIEGASEACVSTAMVMKGECYFLLNKYDECLTVMSLILNEYPHHRKAAMMAQTHIGSVYFARKDFIKARESFEKVIADFKDEDNWPHKNLRGLALLFLARMEMEEKNREKAFGYLEQIYRTWLDSGEANKAAIYIKRYYPEKWEILKNP